MPIVREEWRICNRNNKYEVSNKGMVRSYCTRGSRVGSLDVIPTIIAPIIDNIGRRSVSLGKENRVRIGVLVLEAFVGPRPDGMEMCHGPNGVSDDSITNLSWGTHSKNNGEDKIRDGTDNRGEQHGCARLTEDDVIEIRRIYRQGSKIYGQGALAKRYKVTQSNINAIVSRRSWRHI